MTDAASEVAPGAGAPDPRAAADMAEAFSPHMGHSPPLAWLAASAAFASMLVNQLLLPGLGEHARRELLDTLDHVGRFATNLTAISGLIALGFGLLAFVRYSTMLELRHRLLIGAFAGIFLPTIAIATLLERHTTTAQSVLFALAAAHVLGAIVSVSAARVAPSRLPRTVALCATAMATFVLLAQLLQVMTQAHYATWQAQTQRVLQSSGEVCYLLLLAGMAPLLLPVKADTRSRLARLAGFFVLPIFLGGLYMAENILDNDYTVLLYHAQRVTLFIDSWPRLYAVPLGLALASCFSAVLADDPVRKQGAAGVLLLLSSGYAPHAPGRLLTSALALILIARALMARAERTEPAQS
ncbi:MAG: hypothetical protein ACHQ53_14755 [Polyangiales bacterium]